MIKLNIEVLLKKNNKTKYWLSKQMNVTSNHISKLIKGETTAISFKYIEELCKHLKCSPNELFTIIKK